jgi:hypothetical protein
MIKTHKKIGIEGNFLDTKSVCDEPGANITLNGED